MINKINDAISCRALFFIISFYIGLWTIRIPSIKDQLHTDYIGIGYILGTFAFGSILVMIFANEILKKFPSKVAISFSGIMQGTLWILVPFITELSIFVIFSFIFGCCYGVFEVAINLQASNIEKREKVWKDISSVSGSLQHLDILDDNEKEIFKTAPEINQIYLVEHAHMRQQYVCQSQSVNLFFIMPKATEPQEVHDDYLQYVNDVHWYAMNKLKSLYYFRSDAVRSAENVNIKIPRIKLEDVDCLSCEG